MNLRLGIDVGSTTVKLVLLDEKNKIVYSKYERHMSSVFEKAGEMLKNLKAEMGNISVQSVITGSGGLSLADLIGIKFEQEVIACSKAVEEIIPQTDVAIELGGEDITQQVLDRKGYTFLLISPSLSDADDSNFGNIDNIYEYAQDNHVPFYCLTASDPKAISRWQDLTGAEYPFCLTDGTTLKTIIRSNPGLLLLKDGTIIGKWSHNDLPMAELNKPIAQSEIGQMPVDRTTHKIVVVLLLFVLPLTLLSIADRLWAWSSKVRSAQDRQIDKLKKLESELNIQSFKTKVK